MKTNVPAQGSRLRKKVYWHHPVFYLLLLAGAIPYIVVALLVQKKALVDLGYSPASKALRRNGAIVGWGGSFLGVVLMFAGPTFDSTGISVLIALLLILIAAIAGMVMGRTVWAVKIENDYVWLGGVAREYLAALPSLGI